MGSFTVNLKCEWSLKHGNERCRESCWIKMVHSSHALSSASIVSASQISYIVQKMQLAIKLRERQSFFKITDQ